MYSLRQWVRPAVMSGLALAMFFGAGELDAQRRQPVKNPPKNKPKPPPRPNNHDRGNSSQLPGGLGEIELVNGAPVAVVASSFGGAALSADRAAAILASLRDGQLTGMTGDVLPVEAQVAIFELVSDVSAPAGESRLATALSGSGNTKATLEAVAVATAMRDLLAGSGRIGGAVASYNALVEASSDAFLHSPPAEFLAVRTILGPLVEEALVAHGGRH